MTSPAKSRLIGLGVMIAIMWGTFLTDPMGLANQYGIKPRDQSTLIGILAAPFLHGSYGHLIINTLMMVANFGQRAFLEYWNFWGFIAWSIVLTGALAWAFHPDTNGVPIVGASMLIFASIGHGLGISIFVGDWVGPLFLAAQAWLLWPLWQIMLIPGTGTVDFYGYAIDGSNVSVFGHWAGIIVGLGIAHWRGTTW